MIPRRPSPELYESPNIAIRVGATRTLPDVGTPSREKYAVPCAARDEKDTMIESESPGTTEKDVPGPSYPVGPNEQRNPNVQRPSPSKPESREPGPVTMIAPTGADESFTTPT